MKRSLSLVLVLGLLLIGCGGGGSAGTSPSNSDTEAKGEVVDNTPAQVTYAADANGKVLSIELAGSAESVAVSQNALFVAEGTNGVEILTIGYNDRLSSEFVTKIEGINAKSVTLSEDGSRLYVVNEEGFVNIVNITNLSNPVKERVTTQQEISKSAVTDDGNYEFVPKGTGGLEVYDISNPSNKVLETTFNKSNAFDVVLVNEDTKALVAAGTIGINVLDITTPSIPNSVAKLTLKGEIKGLSLNRDQGLLFVANGDNGVLVYNLNMVLDKLIKAQ